MLKQLAYIPMYVLALFPGDVAQFPVALQPMIQQGYLETDFEDFLSANNGYWVNNDVDVHIEEFQKHRGTTITRTRPGLKAPVVVATDNTAAQTPFNDGVTPSEFAIEQYTFTPFELTDGIDMDLLGTNFAIVNRFEHDLKVTHHQAMQSIDLLARDTYIAGYATGCTIGNGGAAVAAGNGVLISVDDIRGFDTVITVGANSTNGKVVPTSAGFSLPVTILPAGSYTGSYTANCQLATADVVNVSKYVSPILGGSQPYGVPGAPTSARGNGVSGKLTIDVLTKAFNAGDVIIAGDAPPQINSNGVTHYSKLANGMFLQSSNLLDVVSTLQNNGVPFAQNDDGEDEGTYVCHIAPSVRRSLYNDPDFKQANQTLARSEIYKKGKTSQYLGVTFMENTNVPRIPLAPFGGVGYAYLTIMAGQGAVIDSPYAGLEDWAMSEGNPAYVVLDKGIAEIYMPAYGDRQGRRIHLDWLSIRDMICPTDITRSSVVLTGDGSRRARAQALWTWAAR